MQFREELRQKIEYLIDLNYLSKKKVVLFGMNSTVYQAIKILNSNGITATYQVIDQQNETGKMKWGVEEVYYESFFQENYEEFVVLIINNDYLRYKALFDRAGYIINQTVFVDYEIKSEEQKNYNEKKFGLKGKINSILEIKNAYKIYHILRKKFGDDKPVLICNYTGIGDVYLICMYLDSYLKQMNCKDCIITVIGKACMKVVTLFGIANVYNLTVQESELLVKLSMYLQDENRLRDLMQMPQNPNFILHNFVGKRLNLKQMYIYSVFHLLNDSPNFPVFLEDAVFVKEFFARNNLIPGYTVILSPYANSTVGYRKEVWEQIADRLQKRGMTVCTNCSGREPAIKNTISVSFELNLAPQVLEYAGYFIALRSGFCDIVSQAKCNKFVVLYPDYNNFNGVGVYEFCSLEKMELSDHIIEIKCRFDQENLLVEKVLEVIG